MDLPIRLREQRHLRRDLWIARMAYVSWKARYANGGYWVETWRHRPGGGTLIKRLRWHACNKPTDDRSYP